MKIESQLKASIVRLQSSRCYLRQNGSLKKIVI